MVGPPAFRADSRRLNWQQQPGRAAIGYDRFRHPQSFETRFSPDLPDSRTLGGKAAGEPKYGDRHDRGLTVAQSAGAILRVRQSRPVSLKL